jgi:hypothetical protein
MPMQLDSFLTPVLALIVWTLIVWIWMYATRLPAIQRAKVDPQSAKHPGSLDHLPSHVRAVADNYNHLLEQPVIFYALMFYVDLVGHGDHFALWLAWIYVGLRVVHSLVQNTSNYVPLRFFVFALSTVALMIMAGREVLTLFGVLAS